MTVDAPHVVTLGECLIALVATDPGPLAEATRFRRYVAGAEANVAVGLARLGHPSAFIGRIGADGLGTTILRRLRGEGVNVSSLRIDEDGATAVMLRERRRLGPSEVIYHRTASAGSRLSAADVDEALAQGLFSDARWIHVTGITPALSASAREAVWRTVDHARSADVTVSLDVNLRRKLWSDAEAAPVLTELAAKADTVLGDREELAAILRRSADEDPLSLAEAMLGLGPSTVVVKLGADGAAAVASDGTRSSRPALPVGDPVDTVGAGDAFTAGWISARLDGADMEDALERGNACGASAVAAEGDMTGSPTRRELERLLAGGRSDTLR